MTYRVASHLRPVLNQESQGHVPSRGKRNPAGTGKTPDQTASRGKAQSMPVELRMVTRHTYLH